MALHSIRVIASTARINLVMTWRYFSWGGFALRFFAPLMTLGAAWVLFNGVYPNSAPNVGTPNYLSFITVGNAFYVFVFGASFVVGRVMFWERTMGTIEATFLTPMNRLAYMTGVMAAAGINSVVDFTAVFFIGALFGFQASSFNVPLFLSAMLLTAFALFGIGLITNAVTLTFRDRVNTANTLMVLFMVFSGIVCPVELMPAWAQWVSKALPLTYGIRMMRASLFGITTYDATGDLVALAILGIFFVALGAVTLRLIERNLKKKALFSVV